MKSSCPIAPTGKNGRAGMEILFQHVQKHESKKEDEMAEYQSRLRELEDKLAQLMRLQKAEDAASKQLAIPNLPQ